MKIRNSHGARVPADISSTVSESGEQIRTEELWKSFTREDGSDVHAVAGLSLSVNAGEFLVLLGPSGCGKTTLLRLVAGLETADSGRIALGGELVYDKSARVNVPPERRNAGMVFQSYALWPHMSVSSNVAYPLRNAGLNRADIRSRTQEALERVGVGQLGGQYPTQLSGGQQQRVALARATVARRNIVLFDEPLSNVDAKVREQLRIEILRMQRDMGFTALYVTHDQEEAMTLGTRIAVLREGEIAQIGTPREVYETPMSAYVASFIGSVDQFEGRVSGRDDGQLIVSGNDGGTWHVRSSRGLTGGVIVMARPERWALVSESAGLPNLVDGVIDAAVYMGGSRMEYLIGSGRGLIRASNVQGSELRRGDKVRLYQRPEDLLVFDAD